MDASSVVFTIGTVADPAHNLLAKLCSQVITAEIGDAWTAAIKNVSSVDGYVIGDIIPFDPGRYLSLQTKSKFPLLAVYRDKKKFGDHSLLKQKKETDWFIVYVLPELDIQGMGVLYDILNAVSDAIASTVWNRVHPAFADGYDILGTLGFSEFDITDVKVGNFEALAGDSTIVLPTVWMTAHTVEIGDFNPPLVSYGGANIDIRLATFDGYEKIDHFVDIDTDHIPPGDS